MILQSLVEYYEVLANEGIVSRPGWCSAKVSFGISLREDGSIRGVIDLRKEEVKGKKSVLLPTNIEVPQMVSRSSGVLANFLCDNSKYLLGIDKDGSNVRSKECFEAAKDLHLRYLKDVSGDAAETVKKFFKKWDPDCVKECKEICEVWEDITAGGNLIFALPTYAQDDPEIRQRWEEIYESQKADNVGTCLVTGKKSEIARIHATVKGVQGAQSSGAALVSFNAPAFESYEKSQSYNAPVGKYAAFAYTTALNHLLAQKEYIFQFGETTVLFWAEKVEKIYQDIFSFALEPQVDNQEEIKKIFHALENDEEITVNDIVLDKNKQFYILGLSPNAARLSVRFFYQNEFGEILKNFSEHYDRMEIVKPKWDNRQYLSVNAMIQETVNQNSKEKKPKANMVGVLMQSILSNGRYPESLYSNILLRIRCEQGKVTRGRAAVIKAYLMKNKNILKEDDFVSLNEKTTDVGYVLGRIFAILEGIQESANPEINATIRDRYYNSASTTPSLVFPILIRLKNSHIRKLDGKKEAAKVYYEKNLTDLMSKINEFPARLSLEQQGSFALGYYHQVQKRFEKKEDK